MEAPEKLVGCPEQRGVKISMAQTASMSGALEKWIHIWKRPRVDIS